MTLSQSLPCNHPSFANPLTFCIPYQMLLTSFTWKHMYTYTSENNFGPSNQITVTTGYNYCKLTLLGQYTILFYIIFSQPNFSSVQNKMYSLFILHIPFDLKM